MKTASASASASAAAASVAVVPTGLQSSFRGTGKKGIVRSAAGKDGHIGDLELGEEAEFMVMEREEKESVEKYMREHQKELNQIEKRKSLQFIFINKSNGDICEHHQFYVDRKAKKLPTISSQSKYISSTRSDFNQVESLSKSQSKNTMAEGFSLCG